MKKFSKVIEAVVLYSKSSGETVWRMFQNSLHGLVLCTVGTAFTWRCKIAFRHTNINICILTHIYIYIYMYVYVYIYMYIYLCKRCSTNVGYIKEYTALLLRHSRGDVKLHLDTQI